MTIIQRLTIVVLLAGLFSGIPLAGLSPAGEPSKAATLVDVRKIWEQAPHNAFTDLIRFKGQWYCVFREGQRHVSPDGSLRVITSPNGTDWESAALITSPTSDLRDAKISITPDGQLMLAGAEAVNQPKTHRHQSLVWFSKNGRQWSKRHEVGTRDNWLWRISWHRGTAYGFGYSTQKNARGLRLFKSDDGRKFETLIEKVDVAGSYPNETSLLFQKDDTAYCLLRQDGEPKVGYLGTSQPPYSQWQWKNLNARIGGPELTQHPDGRLFAVVRLYDGKTRTSLCEVDPVMGKLTEVLKLPSGGDTSYAGTLRHDGLLWVSYYSSHEGKAAIYLAKVKFGPTD